MKRRTTTCSTVGAARLIRAAERLLGDLHPKTALVTSIVTVPCFSALRAPD
jgi:hypothetical protein